jgi:hypothetical protein
MPKCYKEFFSRKNGKIKPKGEISNIPDGFTKVYINLKKDKLTDWQK